METNLPTKKSAPNIMEILSDKENKKEQYPVTGRNEPCPCGSGKKYKKCHGKKIN